MYFFIVILFNLFKPYFFNKNASYKVIDLDFFMYKQMTKI